MKIIILLLLLFLTGCASLIPARLNIKPAETAITRSETTEDPAAEVRREVHVRIRPVRGAAP